MREPRSSWPSTAPGPTWWDSKSLLRPFEAVICAESAHINVDECGAPERFLGSKLVAVATPDGKLTPELVEAAAVGVGDEHHVQPRVVSITQSTEVGTCYRIEEVVGAGRMGPRTGYVAPPGRGPAVQRLCIIGVGPGGIRIGRRGGRPLVRRDQERGHGSGGRRVVPARRDCRIALHPQTVHAAGFQDAFHRRPVRGAAQRTTSGCEMRPTPTPWPGDWPRGSPICPG